MRGTDLSIIKESFELFNSSNSSYSISSHRAMAKNERRSMSDPSEVMGGSDLRCLKPQSQKFQSRELEIAFEHKSAQWELFYHVIQNSIWDLSRSKEKKGRIRLKNHSWIMSTGRERNGGEKWSIPKAEKTKKVNNFSNLILPKLKPSFKLALTSSDYIPSRKEKNNDQRQKTFFYFLTSFFLKENFVWNDF